MKNIPSPSPKVKSQLIKASMLFTAAYAALSPSLAFAEGESAGDGGLTSQVTQLFSNTNTLILTVYWGIVAIIGGLTLVIIAAKLIHCLFSTEGEGVNSPTFKRLATDAVWAVVVVLAFALAPVFIPLVVSFFGGSSDVVSSFSSVSSK